MRKRIFTLLTALALLCLTACGGGGSGTSAEVQSAYAYILTSARQVNDSIDAELYRYDYNGDGADDWIMFIVEDSCPVWMLLDGGSLDSSPTLLCDRQGGGAAVKLYTSSSEGKLFVEFLYSSSSIGSSSYHCFDGKLADSCAYSEHRSGNYEYEVNGEIATEAEYDAFIDGLELHELQDGSAFTSALDLGSSDMDNLSAAIANFSFVQSENSVDIDGDGSLDYLFCSVLDDGAPKGISAAGYDAGEVADYEVGSWRTAYFALMSNSSSPKLLAISQAKYNEYMRSVSDISEDNLQGEFPVGKWVSRDYDVDYAYYLYNDGLFEYKSDDFYVEGRWYISSGTVMLEQYENGSYVYYMELGIEGDMLGEYAGKTTAYLVRAG